MMIALTKEPIVFMPPNDRPKVNKHIIRARNAFLVSLDLAQYRSLLLKCLMNKQYVSLDIACAILDIAWR